ncbi:MAG: hypothetical protein EZS26_001576 [Candidatus Ordinivivax streblomastigis]|uniref:IgGFc-binding protein N-terminal domain-containing protein n=1 Tax=Candidatus Ordinivivax streblomastigis TaxID=2540710 RepID=A0A5M8P1H9_9BACT|nr:MAG: hypothetical protein EZS26_001576 [Candidatus Ordinivivax streblomastigis]
MKTRLTRLLFLAAMLVAEMSVQAQVLSSVCGWNYEVGNQTDWVSYKMETSPNGNLVISIMPHPNNVNDMVSFRNAMDVSNFKVNELSGNFFTLLSGGNNATELVYQPTTLIPSEAIITYSGLIEWRTNGNGNAYNMNVTLPNYTYGTNCTGIYTQKLATPTNVAISNTNVLTFDEITNANKYIVSVSFNGNLLKTLNMSGSGETITFPILNGTFDISVIASDTEANYSNSDASQSNTWIVNNQDAIINAPSIYCEHLLKSGAYLSWETASQADASYEAGDLLLTISGEKAGWRAAGVRAAGFTVTGISGLFIKISGDTDNPQVFRPIAGISIPKGTIINYNATTEYLSIQDNNLYDEPLIRSNYVYGSDCQSVPPLTTPTSLNYGNNNVLTFTGDANAGSFTVGVFLNNNLIFSIPNFTSGSTVEFPLNGSFVLKVKALTGSINYLDSEWSEGVSMVLAHTDDDLTNLMSEVCNSLIDPPIGSNTFADSEDAIYVTWGINANSEITVTIEGYSDTYKATTRLRDNGFNINNLKIGGVVATDIITTSFDAEKRVQTYTPRTGITIPLGTTITYNGIVEYQLIEQDGDATLLDNLWPTMNFTYTYGTTCTPLELASSWLPQGESTDWSNPQNWSTGVVPTNANNIVIPVSGTYPSIPNGTAVKSITFAEGAGIAIPSGSVTVSESVKVEYVVNSNRWYSIGFPFKIDRIYSEKLGGDLVAYNVLTGGNYWLKSYDGVRNEFGYTNNITANNGYIVQFPEYFDNSKVTFIAQTPDMALSNGKDFPVSTDYALLANPNVIHQPLELEATKRYYKYLPNTNKFVLVEEGPYILAPFEAAVSFNNISQAPMRKNIGEDWDDYTGINGYIAPLDVVSSQKYYTLQGLEINHPVANEIYIVKRLHASGKESLIKTIYTQK